MDRSGAARRISTSTERASLLNSSSFRSSAGVLRPGTYLNTESLHQNRHEMYHSGQLIIFHVENVMENVMENVINII